jgi:penicillin-binding protein 2
MKKNKKRIRASQIMTFMRDPNTAAEEEIFVLPTGELHSMADAIPEKRLRFLGMAAIVLLAVVAVRSIYLQASQGIFRKQAEGNWLRMLTEYAPRGVIFDRNGKQLVQNVASTDLVVYPVQLPSDVESEIKILREIFSDVPAGAFQEIINSSDRTSPRPVPLLSNITHEQMVGVLARLPDLPGIGIENLPTREYTEKDSFAHILGFTGKVSKADLEKNPKYMLTEYVGKSGLEKQYEDLLRGEHGARREEVDSGGRIKNILGTIPAKPGMNLKLNIDAELQKKLYESLKKQLDNARVAKGAAVAIDPKTGGVLALVSIPSFDNTKLTQGMTGKEAEDLFTNKDQPLLDRAIQGEYPPGSTFKLAVAIAGLEEKIITPDTTVNSTGGIHVGSWFFPDWKAGGHGTTSLFKAIAESVNTYFYTVGGGIDGKQGLGIEKMSEWAKKLGFGAATGIDIPGESDGFLPSPDWKMKTKNEAWYIGDTYHAAIGQGDVLITPIQMASLTATIANGGKIYEPHIVKELLNNNGSLLEEIKTKEKGKIDSDVANLMRQAMRETVLSGSGRALADMSVAIAGKTGTAQTTSGLDNTHAWFTAFAPYDNPEIALTVLLEKGGGGDKFAVPVVKDVFSWYFGERLDEQAKKN